MRRLISLLLFVSISLAGCGSYDPLSVVQFVTAASKGGSGNSDSNPALGGAGSTPAQTSPALPTRSLKSLSIQPENRSVPLGSDLVFSAMGTYSDGTTEDLTQSVIWSTTGSQSVAEFLGEPIARAGVIRASGRGAATVMASYNGTVASTRLIVTEPEVELIDLSVADSTVQLAIGAKFKLFASGWYTNRENRPLTDAIRCRLADTRVAVITSTPDVNCIVVGLASGMTSLTVSADHAQREVTIEVLPIQTLDSLDEGGFGGSMMGIDENGNILAVWRRWPTEPGRFHSSRYDVSKGTWSDSGLVDTQQSLLYDFKFSMNRAGQALLVWSGPQGVFSSAYLPGSGWQANKRALADSNGTLVDAKIDPDGKGRVAWLNGNLYIVEEVSGSGWSAPSDRGPASSASFAMNSEGDALLVRQDSSLFASYFKKGSGWQPEVVLSNAASNLSHQVAMDTFGGMVLWTENSGIKAARYDRTDGWKPREALSGITPSGFLPLALAVSPDGHAIVMWANSANFKLEYSFFNPGLGWRNPEVLGFGLGPVQVRMDADGNVLATWTFGQTIGISRYLQTTGWEKDELLPALRGFTPGPNLEMNDSGAATVIWDQGGDLYIYRVRL